MIVILDYDMGNVGSIQNILYRAGQKDVKISRQEDDIAKADKLIIPGVGAFDSGMNNLKKYNLVELIQNMAMKEKKPILGICLGMQLLGRRSEEGNVDGLGLIPFDNIRFKVNAEYKVPHMGWNYINGVSQEMG